MNETRAGQGKADGDAAVGRPARRTERDAELIAALDRVIAEAGGEPESADGMRIRELMHTALKLIRDGADLGELKLLSRSMKELRYAMKVFRKYENARKISIFGSARTRPDDPVYHAAQQFSQQMAGAGWMVITGAGDGIMRAGHGGAGREASFGVAIRLPFETSANDVIAGDAKLITFRYFFTRKLMFMWQAHAVALFPGGFGTHDEGFEALTLMQTGKAPLAPIVMIDREGGSYWREWHDYVQRQLLGAQMISPQDLNLYHLASDPQDAARHVLHFYRNYHSQRFVQDTLVLRLLRPLRDEQVAALNEEFAPLVAEGRIEQGGPMEPEREHLELPRLAFTFTKRDYGTLRAMIDRINDYDAENSPASDEAGARVSPPYSDLADQTSPW